MEEKPKSFSYLDDRTQLVFRPSLLAPIPLIATIPLYPPNNHMITDVFLDQAMTDSFTVAMGVTCLILSLAMLAFSIRYPGWSKFKRWIQTGAALGYVLSHIGFYLCLLKGLSTLLPVCFGIVAGACIIPIILLWIESFYFDLRNILLYGAIICLTSAVFTWLLSHSSALLVAIIVPVLLVLSVGIPLISHSKRPAAIHSDDCSDDSEAASTGEVALAETPIDLRDLGSEGSQQNKLSVSIRGLISVVWLPLLSFLFCTFIMSVFSYSVPGGITGEFSGSIIASVLAIALCVFHFKTSLVVLINKLVLPTIVIICILLRTFPIENSPFLLGISSIHTPLIFLTLFAFSILVAVVATGEFPLPFIFGATFSAGNLVALAGALLVQLFLPYTDQFGPLLWILRGLFFSIIIFQLAYSSWRQFSSSKDSDELPDDVIEIDSQLGNAYWSKRIEVVAKEKGLTSRECELLEYLQRGYSLKFIANTLFISINTVRTHIRNIYRKLGVTSRVELLVMLNEIKG